MLKVFAADVMHHAIYCPLTLHFVKFANQQFVILVVMS